MDMIEQILEKTGLNHDQLKAIIVLTATCKRYDHCENCPLYDKRYDACLRHDIPCFWLDTIKDRSEEET